jgi:hypothetical protein
MDNFKLASQQQLRFQTNKGLLSVEQLWTLTLIELSNLCKSIKKVLKGTDNDDDLSFLIENSIVDVENQLRFDIAKDVYLTRKKENEEKRNALIAKEQKQKILEIIAKKKDESLENKSIEELEALLA